MLHRTRRMTSSSVANQVQHVTLFISRGFLLQISRNYFPPASSRFPPASEHELFIFAPPSRGKGKFCRIIIIIFIISRAEQQPERWHCAEDVVRGSSELHFFCTECSAGAAPGVATHGSLVVHVTESGSPDAVGGLTNCVMVLELPKNVGKLDSIKILLEYR